MASTVPFELITPTRPRFRRRRRARDRGRDRRRRGHPAVARAVFAALGPGVLRANVVKDGSRPDSNSPPAKASCRRCPDRVTVLVGDALRFEDVDVAKSREELRASLRSAKSRGVRTLPRYAREQAIIDFARHQAAPDRPLGQGKP